MKAVIETGRRSISLRAFLLLGALTLCLVSILAGWWVLSLLDYTEQLFGPPAENLELSQRLYLSSRLLFQQNSLKTPVDVLGSPQPFEIQLNESPLTVAARLEQQGLVHDAAALVNYLVYSGLDISLQAGKYELSARMNALEIAHALQDATPHEVTFVVFPGWRLEEIAEAIPTSGLQFSPRAFLEAVRHPAAISPLIAEMPPSASLEGFLFPDSYRLPRQIALDGFLRTTLEDFQIKVDISMRQAYLDRGLSLYQAVTLASIVEREAMMDDEMPTIASVFFNRLAAGMKLETDPTVQYALGYNHAQKTWWTNPLSLKNLQSDSPYNTYLYEGLPPGPISNPGLNALKAVAYPAQTPYLYFRAACDGSGQHSFAQTFEQHQQNACP